jgi:hypothetical protein
VIALADYAAFRALRPFIRAGRDFVLVQEMLADGLSAADQDEFDERVRRAGEEKLGTYDSLLYQVRDDLLSREPQTWLGLNRPFGSLASALRDAAGKSSVWIVSTKRPEYIRRILAHWTIDWPLDRIVFPGGRTKIDVITGLMEENDIAEGVFVDDQPDHLRCRAGSGLKCVFGGWAHGLSRPHGRTDVQSIDLDGLCELIGGMA